MYAAPTGLCECGNTVRTGRHDLQIEERSAQLLYR